MGVDDTHDTLTHARSVPAAVAHAATAASAWQQGAVLEGTMHV